MYPLIYLQYFQIMHSKLTKIFEEYLVDTIQRCEKSINTSSENLVPSPLSCQVHPFLCTYARRVIRKIRKYTCASVSGVSERVLSVVLKLWQSQKQLREHATICRLSITSPLFLVAPEDQVMRTWGSSFRRITGVQYAKLVSNCNNL